MDEDSGKIIDFSLVQVSEVSSSNAMENEGCQRSLNKVIDQNVHIRSLSTDRHTQITSEMRKKYPSIIHQYDVWHLGFLFFLLVCFSGRVPLEPPHC